MNSVRQTIETQAMQRPEPRRDRRARLSSRKQNLGSFFRSALNIVWSTLREIFDESAYARFLDRQKLDNSRAAYTAFLQENQKHRERRPRCC
jgi:hypothetical protein